MVLYYFAPHAGQTWCGRFFSPHFLQTPHGMTDNASWLRRCALRALLVLLFGVAILQSFYIKLVIFYSIIPVLQGKVYPGWTTQLVIQPDYLSDIRYPTIVAVRHLRVQFFQPFLLLWQLHEHDGRMHRFQLESNDQQSSFH